jgi:hypothetical protein
MREVVLQVWCDVCEKSLAEDDAINLQITSDRGNAYEMDLCAGCLGDYLQPARPMKPTRKTGEHPCDQCDFVGKTTSGLGLHKKRKHTTEGTDQDE